MSEQPPVQEWSDDLVLILKEEVGVSVAELLNFVKLDALRSFYNNGYSARQTVFLIVVALRTAAKKDISITEPQTYKWLHEMYLTHEE